MSEPIPVAVLGAGHMGRHHVRKYAQMPGAKLIAVIDRDLDRARALAAEHGAIGAASWTPELPPIRAASVAVPTVHHLRAAEPLLERGIHLLIEKPLAATSIEAERIAELARRHGAIVQVGHTERFNPAVRAVARMGVRPRFAQTQRVSPFTFRSADVGVVFDMMIHDIDIVLHLFHDEVVHVDAVGVGVLSRFEDIASARVRFRGGGVADLSASRLALKTDRRLRVFSEDAYVTLDYQNKSGLAIKRDRNWDVIRFARERQIEDLAQLAGTDISKMVQVEPLTIDDKDALQDELETFLAAVRTGTAPEVTVEDGCNAVRLAEQIVQEIQRHRWDGELGPRMGLDADIVSGRFEPS